MYLGLDSLAVLLATLMGVSYIAKLYKHSDMSNVNYRDFRTMIPIQILRKLDLVLYVWSNYKSKGDEYKVIAGMTYDYHVAQVIGYGPMNFTLPCDHRDSP